MSTITISVERFQQLIRAEHDANSLKALIADAYANYESLDRTKLAVLYKLYFGTNEESKEGTEE